MIDDFVTALNDNSQSDISKAMSEAEILSSKLGKKQVELGISQNRISNRLDIIEEKTILYKDILSKTVDTNYSEAITKLSANMLALEAAQSTFAKVSQLSLFDYI
jgi:flagellar hook-associated protein 3 FlgL